MDEKVGKAVFLKPKIDGLDDLRALADEASARLAEAREVIDRMLEVDLEVAVYRDVKGDTRDRT